MKYTLSQESVVELNRRAAVARGAILKATTLAGSGHPGGSMSSIDILLTLYSLANINPDNRLDENRDRIVISHGHISPAVYSALALEGFFPLEDFISQFRVAGSIFEGHIERDVPGVEWGTGNLGQGLSAGCGFALASKIKKIDNRIFVVMGDGEQQKGQLSEARRFAVKYGLNNITAFVDYNRLQIGGLIEEVMPQHIKENYLSDGWKVLEIDGHSFEEIAAAMNEAESFNLPTLILARTIMGKGVPFMEDKEKYHGAAIKEEQLTEALALLGIENDIDKLKTLRRDFKPKNVDDTNRKKSSSFFSSILVGSPRVYNETLDNRSAWGNALSDIAAANKEKAGDNYTPIAVFDCDLQGSVKTVAFENILPNNFFQAGIAEHHTATTAGSISIENILTFFAGFGVFGVDETYNQHRLNDINESNLKLIVTHVGLDVGEDGKTHQCVDYIGLMRNLYRFKIVVPLCPNQTDRVIRYISQQEGNFLVAMGRSKVPIIRKEDGSVFYDENYEFQYGKADLLRDGKDGALLVTGSVAARSVEVIDKLKARGISLQLWAVSCPTEIDAEMLQRAAQTGKLFTYEDHNVNSGLGSIVADTMVKLRLNCPLTKFGVEGYCTSGKAEDVYRFAGLDTDSIVAKIVKEM